jgi:hypothetical protein
MIGFAPAGRSNDATAPLFGYPLATKWWITLVFGIRANYSVRYDNDRVGIGSFRRDADLVRDPTIQISADEIEQRQDRKKTPIPKAIGPRRCCGNKKAGHLRGRLFID